MPYHSFYAMSLLNKYSLSPLKLTFKNCIFKAQEYIFKYIVQSRRLFSLATGGQNEEEFRCCIQELLMSVRFFLSQESKGSGALSQSQVISFHLCWVEESDKCSLFIFTQQCNQMFSPSKSIAPVYICSLTNFMSRLLKFPHLLCTSWAEVGCLSLLSLHGEAIGLHQLHFQLPEHILMIGHAITTSPGEGISLEPISCSSFPQASHCILICQLENHYIGLS